MTTVLLLLLHLILFPLVVFSGYTVAINFIVSPSSTAALVLLRTTSVIGISFFSTVIVQLAVFPFELVAVITTVPACFAVTFPVESTVAISLLLLLQPMFLDSVVFSGSTVAVKFNISPSVIVALVLLSATSTIGISFLLTVTVQPAVFPFVLVAVIITVPAFFASTCPVVSTVAMSLLLLLQLISFVSVVFSGRTVAVSVV